jgi:hypothetical protein
MTTLRIYDCNNGVLAVDLRHLFDLLVPCSLQATWIVSPVKLFSPTLNSFLEDFETTGRGEDQLEALARNGLPVNGTVLAELSKATRQVIWGEFTAFLTPQESAWVTIRAIDSTFYELSTTDPVVLDKIKLACKDVRIALGPATSIPIPQVQRTSS